MIYTYVYHTFKFTDYSLWDNVLYNRIQLCDDRFDFKNRDTNCGKLKATFSFLNLIPQKHSNGNSINQYVIVHHFHHDLLY